MSEYRSVLLSLSENSEPTRRNYFGQHTLVWHPSSLYLSSLATIYPCAFSPRSFLLRRRSGFCDMRLEASVVAKAKELRRRLKGEGDASRMRGTMRRGCRPRCHGWGIAVAVVVGAILDVFVVTASDIDKEIGRRLFQFGPNVLPDTACRRG